MLTMAARLSKDGICLYAKDDEDVLDDFARASLTHIASGIIEAQRVVADNVSDFLVQNYIGEDGLIYVQTSDFPCIMPPFDRMFLEWRLQEKQFGMLVQSGEKDSKLWSSMQEKTGAFSDGSFKAITVFPVKVIKGEVAWDQSAMAITIDRLGQPLDSRFTGSFFGCEGTYVSMLCATLSFMNCRKNITVVDASDQFQPPEKWLRRFKQPKLKYYVLEIDHAASVLRTEGGLSGNGLKKALHICRGHFARYSEEKPLFGKYSGVFWISQHLRGSKEVGEIVKDYEVK